MFLTERESRVMHTSLRPALRAVYTINNDVSAPLLYKENCNVQPKNSHQKYQSFVHYNLSIW